MDRVGRRAVAGLSVLTLGLLAVAHSVIALNRSHETTSDWASIEMRTRDVFSRHPPLIGAWSRYEWSHPGPLMFYVLALPYRIGGQHWQALWIGAVLVNGAAVGLAVWLAARRSAGFGLAVLLAGLATVAGFRSHLLVDVWNATIVVLPVLLVLVAVVGVLSGDRVAWPILVCTYMFVAQCHFGYGVVLLPVAVWAGVVAFRTWRRSFVRWVAVGVALWVPVMIDTLANWPGNFLTSIGWNLRNSSEQARGFGEALRVIGRASSLSFLSNPGVPSFDVAIARPPWGLFPFAAVLALGVAWWVARRLGFVVERVAASVAGATWLAGFVAVARVKGPLFRWIVDWTYTLVALTWALVALVAAQAVLVLLDRATSGGFHMESADEESTWNPPTRNPHGIRGRGIHMESARRGRAGRWCLAGAGVAAAVTFAVVNVVGSVGEPYINAQWVPIVRQFTRAAEAVPQVHGEPIFVDFDGEARLAGAIQSGMVNLMEKHGLDPRVRRSQGLQFGGHRIAPECRPSPEPVCVKPIDKLLVRVEAHTGGQPANAQTLSVWDPLTPDERAEADRLTDDLTALLTANGLAGKAPVLFTDVADLAAYQAPPAVTARIDEFRRLAELRRRGPRVVLYVVPAG